VSYRIDPRPSLTAEIRRIASEEIGEAIEDLVAARTEPEVKLHACRKHLKKLRALFRLVRSADEDFYHAENARYRDMARTLAGGREATALIETVDRLAKEFPKKAADGQLHGLRAALVARRTALLHPDTGIHVDIDAAVAGCESGRAALASFDLPGKPQAAADLLGKGARMTMRHIAKALKVAHKHGHADNFHELRKGVKAHWMHLLLLHDFWPRPFKRRCKAVDKLGECLGDLHDLSVLHDLLGAEGDALGSQKELALLGRLIARSEKKLRKQCLRKADKLFDKPPRKAARKVAKNYKATPRRPWMRQADGRMRPVRKRSEPATYVSSSGSVPASLSGSRTK
jgi:CHAD domain-containing protein